MNFEAYLTSKKIDPAAFAQAEPDLFQEWKSEFDQMHPNSFTVQKLNLINPIRRKYLLPPAAAVNADPKSPAAPGSARPVTQPKTKS